MAVFVPGKLPLKVIPRSKLPLSSHQETRSGIVTFENDIHAPRKPDIRTHQIWTPIPFESDTSISCDIQHSTSPLKSVPRNSILEMAERRSLGRPRFWENRGCAVY